MDVETIVSWKVTTGIREFRKAEGVKKQRNK